MQPIELNWSYFSDLTHAQIDWGLLHLPCKCREHRMDSRAHFQGNGPVVCSCRRDPTVSNADCRLWKVVWVIFVYRAVIFVLLMWLTRKAIWLQARVQIQATYHKVIGKAWKLRIRIPFQLIQLRLFTRRCRWLHHGHWCCRGCYRAVVATVATAAAATVGAAAAVAAAGIVKHQFGQTTCNIFTRCHNLFVCCLCCSLLQIVHQTNTSMCACMYMWLSVCLSLNVCVCIYCYYRCALARFLPLSNLSDGAKDVNVP